MKISRSLEFVCLVLSLGCGNRLFSGSSDGRLVHWDPVKGDNDVVKGKGHTSQVQMLVPKGQDELLSIGWDDQLKVISLSSE